MMTISAQLVKELRERTGAGMMECKKALTQTGGDIEKAIEEMRKSGQAKADKKASRIAAEGVVVMAKSANKAVIIEINSETDFVARDENFKGFADKVVNAVAASNANTLEEVLALRLTNGETIEDTRKALIAKIGENINVRRVDNLEGETLGVYSHGGRIGVILAMKGGNEELAKDVAMHIAASNPLVVSQNQVPADLVEKEKEIFIAQARESGKPDDIIEKMITGRIRKFLDEQSLAGQPFVKNPDQKVEQLLKANNAIVTEFIRFGVGEGIEKEETNFAAEVMSQVQGA
ncbi:translation elongation factor Ts [Fastidiosibacter lacustris]|uniref:translation elongation factor Ts n=1 Tax=Fastidiosibacter lacustris TaxID=2056695 RepID=UPI0018645DDE|nr:translation elongation factor Ts [Fastidiosibacter lacustris]